MKIHKPLIQGVFNSIVQIFQKNRKADKVIQQIFKENPKWGSRDRAFVAEHTYEIVRWWRLYHFVNGTNIDNTSNEDLWRILGIRLISKGIDSLEINEFKGLNPLEIKNKFSNVSDKIEIKESIPDWLNELALKEIGENWPKLIHSLNQEAPLSIRVNTERISVEGLIKILKDKGIATSKAINVPSALYFNERRNVFALDEFKKGFFEVQDAGSQMIADFLKAAPGMRVIDACAGAGGKALHLACIMKNRGQLIAMDVEEWKLLELRRRAKRNGVQNIETRLIESKTIKRLKESADAVLLDVPCTGLGVLKRNPDAKWKLKPEWVEEVKKIQADILLRYSNMVKPNGTLVYATCSILPSENEIQVAHFLASNPQFILEEEKWTSPMEGYDGFYMARMKKTSNSTQ